MTSTETTPEVDPAAASTLIYLSRTIWQSRRGIGIFTGVLVVIALLVCIFSTSIYRASVTAYPADNSVEASSPLAALASNLGIGGASSALSQLSMTPPIQETLSLLQSRQLTLHFIHKYNILPELFYEKWDSDTNNWESPTWFAIAAAWLQGKEADPKPSDDDAFEAFDDIRTVTVDSVTGVITVSIGWRNPKIAAQWANGLVRETDEVLRQSALGDSKQGLDYLQKQASQSTLSDLRDAIYSVAATEVTKSMLANVQSNFAIKVIDPAAPPEKRDWPKVGFLLVISVLAGLFFGSVGAIVRAYILELRRMAGIVEKPPGSSRFWPPNKIWPLNKIWPPGKSLRLRKRKAGQPGTQGSAASADAKPVLP